MLENFLTWVSLYWSVIEPLIFIFVIFLFFNDPIRRWNFFGYRPTAVMGLYDPHEGKVVFSKVNGYWSFNQGGIYDDNIYVNTAEILQRELGLSHNRFKLVYTKPLGKVKISNRTILTRARISAFTISPRLRGKGYIGCFIRVDMKEMEGAINKGAGIEAVRIVDFEEARRLVDKFCEHEEHNPTKRNMVMYMLDEIEAYCKTVKKWEEENIIKKRHEDTNKMENENKQTDDSNKDGSENKEEE